METNHRVSILTSIFTSIVVLLSVGFVSAQTVEGRLLIPLDAPRDTMPTKQTTTIIKQSSRTDSQISSIRTSYSSESAPFPGCEQQLFRISGYYSPKPNQSIYNRDNYDAEIKLNGRGTHGAS